jgi:flagellin-like protein
MRNSRKAISEIVATVILILIVIAGAAIVYVYSSGTMGRLQGSQPQQPYANQIVLEYYNWNNNSTNQMTHLTLYLRNAGSGRGLLGDFFVNATLVTLTGSCTTYTTTPLLPGNTCTAILSVSAIPKAPIAGYAYAVRLVTKDGSVFSYNLIAGQSGAPV